MNCGQRPSTTTKQKQNALLPQAKTRTDDDETPLMLAAMYGCGGVIDTLVECGAKVNARTKSGKTALTLAKSNLTDRDTSGAVKALVKHGGTI